MTNSEPTPDVAEILDEILGLLDEELMRREIDERIEDAVAHFQYDDKEGVTHTVFTRLITDFVRHIYQHGMRLPRDLSRSEALAESVSILEQGYRGPHERGYDAAYLDALNPEQNGILIVINAMAETIKAMERRKYIRWVFKSCLDHSDWQCRCKIAELLLERLTPFLHPYVLQCNPAQLADHLPDLVFDHLSTDSILARVLAGNSQLKQPP